mgnify:FL=1
MNYFLHFGRTEKCEKIEIRLNETRVEVVKEFDYLGSKFESNGKLTKELEKRASRGRSVMGTIGRIARNRKLTKNMRLAVHNGILVGGSEA